MLICASVKKTELKASKYNILSYNKCYHYTNKSFSAEVIFMPMKKQKHLFSQSVEALLVTVIQQGPQWTGGKQQMPGDPAP